MFILKWNFSLKQDDNSTKEFILFAGSKVTSLRNVVISSASNNISNLVISTLKNQKKTFGVTVLHYLQPLLASRTLLVPFRTVDLQ